MTSTTTRSDAETRRLSRGAARALAGAGARWLTAWTSGLAEHGPERKPAALAELDRDVDRLLEEHHGDTLLVMNELERLYYTTSTAVLAERIAAGTIARRVAWREQREAELRARREARARRTPADKCRDHVRAIAAATGEEWTFGYIGNVEGARDDRAWYAFGPAGETRTAADRIGGQGTEELAELELILRGAARMARMIGGNR